MNKKLLRGIALAGALTLSATMAACAPAGDNAPPSGGDGTKPKIVFIQQNSGNPYFDNISDGFQEAADAYGFELTVTGPASAAASEQVPLIEDAITQQVAGIAIQASDPEAVAPALKKAVAAGIKVISINSDQLADVRNAAVTPVDFTRAGSEQLDLLGSLMDYEGEFAILSATTTAPFQLGVVDSIKELLKSDAKYAKMELVDVVFGNDEPQKSTTETTGLLTKRPDLKAILAPTSVALPAAAQAIETAGLTGKVILTGLAQPNQMRKFVESGTVSKFQLWVPADQGYVGGALLSQLIAGEIDAAPGSTFDAGDFGSMKIDDLGVVIVADTFTVFDSTNIDNYDF
ncbi:substrate-binding domain-containing protein [Salinibacterium sp. TMP30]|uniref:substrate-binding domain-containing protein n=1 Tax=Salinibacterium sp. TMP30 TaxID=3138237 RepID=UPI003138D181